MTRTLSSRSLALELLFPGLECGDANELDARVSLSLGGVRA